MNIFILEDDFLYRDMIAYDLKKQGHDVTVHGCIEGAVDMILENSFELLCIDITLPPKKEEIGQEIKDGGIQVLRALASRKYIFPPTVFISVLGFEQNRQEIETLKRVNGLNKNFPKMNCYIEKPYNSFLMKKIVEESGK